MFGPTGPSCPLHRGNEAGEASAKAAGRRHPGRLRPGGSACVSELNVGSLEGMGSSTRSRTERPPPSVAWPRARRADRCWSVPLAGDDRVCRVSGLPAGLAKVPGCLEEPSSLRARGAHVSGHRAAAGSGQSAAGGEGLSSEFPSPKLSRQPGPLLHSGSKRWPSVPANSPLLTARPPVQESSQESAGPQPQGPRPLCTPALWPAPVYSVPVYVGLTV